MTLINMPPHQNDDNDDEYLYKVPTINRAVIITIPLQPYYDWCNQLEDDSTEPYGPVHRTEIEAYLVSDNFDDPEKVIKRHYKEIFEMELFGWCTDKEMWPKQRSYPVFKKWFRVEVASLIFDLRSDLPLRHDE